MIKWWFVALFGIVVATPTPPSLGVEIVGGHDINITEAPYQVALSYKGFFGGGGTIVAKDIIITAAHCIIGRNATDFQIRVGSSYSTTGGELYPVREILWHPDFNKEKLLTIDNDIGIMWLSKPIEFSDKVAAIHMLDENEEIADGEETIVTGWGRISETGPFSKILQMIKIPKVNDKVCNDTYITINAFITPRMICAGLPAGGKNVCNGDNGGPMVYNNKLAGVVSWGHGCARPGFPAIYAKISALRSWIDEHIKHFKLKRSFRACH